MAQSTDRTVNIDKLVGLCPYVTMQKVLSGKWTMLIMHELE